MIFIFYKKILNWGECVNFSFLYYFSINSHNGLFLIDLKINYIPLILSVNLYFFNKDYTMYIFSRITTYFLVLSCNSKD